MTTNIPLQPAYVLHTRAYRDTSVLLDLFTQEHGRVSAIARGAKSQRSKFKGLLQPFMPLLISWAGRTDLMTLSIVEANGMAFPLQGDKLLCGFYLNELLVRLLHRYDAHPDLFEIYQQTLMTLHENKLDHQVILRNFEKQLLQELGYALELDREARSATAIKPTQHYFFDPTQGLLPCAVRNTPTRNIFSGASLLALHHSDLTEDHHRNDAKRLLRMALGHLLGNKPIRTRELFLRSTAYEN